MSLDNAKLKYKRRKIALEQLKVNVERGYRYVKYKKVFNTPEYTTKAKEEIESLKKKLNSFNNDAANRHCEKIYYPTNNQMNKNFYINYVDDETVSY